MDDFSTISFQNRLETCEADEDYLEIKALLEKESVKWQNTINEIKVNCNFTDEKLAGLCGVSRQSVSKWYKGAIPKSRDMFIRIGMVAGYDIATINSFLKRWGYSELYAMNLEDSIYIYMLNSKEIETCYQNFLYIRKAIENLLFESVNGEELAFTSTEMFLMNLMRTGSLEEFLAFARKNAETFSKQYLKLYDYVERYIQKNIESSGDSKFSIYALQNENEWSASLRRCVSEIKNHKWYPQRSKLISLGIHLNMNLDEINEMLELAHMEKLYAKNPFESAIIYALIKADLEDLIVPGGIDLCYVVKAILSKFDYKDVEFFMMELPEDDVI